MIVVAIFRVVGFPERVLVSIPCIQNRAYWLTCKEDIRKLALAFPALLYLAAAGLLLVAVLVTLYYASLWIDLPSTFCANCSALTEDRFAILRFKLYLCQLSSYKSFEVECVWRIHLLGTIMVSLLFRVGESYLTWKTSKHGALRFIWFGLMSLEGRVEFTENCRHFLYLLI